MSNAITNGFTISNGTITKHSLTNYGLAVANTNYLGDPEMETFTVNVPGRAGLLDLSTSLTGYPVFKTRTISIEVGAVKPSADWDGFISTMRNNFEGRTCTIIFDNDTSWYWRGRVHIKEFDRHRNLGTFKIEMLADAHKHQVTPTVDTYVCSQQFKPVTFRSTNVPIAPLFKCTQASGTMAILVHTVGQSGQTYYEMHQGDELYVPGLLSTTTGLEVSVGQTGTITVTWEEMSL